MAKLTKKKIEAAEELFPIEATPVHTKIAEFELDLIPAVQDENAQPLLFSMDSTETISTAVVEIKEDGKVEILAEKTVVKQPAKPKAKRKSALDKLKETIKEATPADAVKEAAAVLTEIAATLPTESEQENDVYFSMDDERLDINEIKAQYFDEATLLLQPEPMYRVDGAGLRTYYTYNGGELISKKTKNKAAVYSEPFIKFYISVTSIIQATTPTSPHLIAWIAKEGDNAEIIKEERADYGTLMHSEFENVLKALINKDVYDLDAIPNVVTTYIIENDIQNCDKIMWIEDLKQDVLAFCKFCVDYNVRPLAIEIVLKCDKYGTGGAIDLACMLDIETKGFFGETYASGAQKGMPKETKRKETKTAIVDFKSSRKGVHESHELQLGFYEEAFKENFPQYRDSEIMLFNYRPKNWQKHPDFVLTNQTGKHTSKELELLSNIFYLKNNLNEKERTLIGGMVDFAKPNINRNYRRVHMAKLIIDRKKK